MANPNRQRLAELFNYNPDTGVLAYINNTQGHNIGDLCGCILNNGYRQLWIDGKKFLAHRVVFFIINGYWPKYIDHINGDRDDNRINNLRVATPRSNQQNRVEHRNQGRLVGAQYTHTMKSKPWRSVIRINGKSRHLGYYETEQEAHNTYMQACVGL